MTTDFLSVTKVPGLRATAEQLSMLYTRYHLAAEHCRGRQVLEVACGSGMGLGYLARHASRLVAGDVSAQVIEIARATYKDRSEIKLHVFDAQSLPFHDESFDTVILYEAVYYFPAPEKFLGEARRVLRPGGTLLMNTVNKEWDGFHPSPYNVRYFSAQELLHLLKESGFHPSLFGGFPDIADSVNKRIVSAIRRRAVRLNLIPDTLKGREWLKRLFYGPMIPLARELMEGMAPLAPLCNLADERQTNRFKVIYIVAHLGSKKGL